MTSVQSAFAQRLTRTFVVTQAGPSENGAYLFPDDAVDVWYAANASKITKVSESLYVITGTASGTTFVDVVRGDNGSSPELGGSGALPTVTERKSLKDFGTEVVIGNGIESRLLVLRRVQQYSNSTDGGASDPSYTGYVIVENNADDLGGNTGRFTVRVARV